jgi:hypothetical protein
MTEKGGKAESGIIFEIRLRNGFKDLDFFWAVDPQNPPLMMVSKPFGVAFPSSLHQINPPKLKVDSTASMIAYNRLRGLCLLHPMYRNLRL